MGQNINYTGAHAYTLWASHTDTVIWDSLYIIMYEKIRVQDGTVPFIKLPYI